MNFRPYPLALVSLLLFAFPAKVGADNFVGTFDDWHVQTYKEGDAKVCLMWSQPKKSAGDYKSRGDVYAYVTHRPARKRLNEVSISTGYAFKKDSTLDVTVVDQTFSLFTDGDTAWNRTPDADEKMVAAMKAGITMSAAGVSARGTKTTDTYSLSGFTKAHTAMSKACKIKK